LSSKVTSWPAEVSSLCRIILPFLIIALLDNPLPINSIMNMPSETMLGNSIYLTFLTIGGSLKSAVWLYEATKPSRFILLYNSFLCLR